IFPPKGDPQMGAVDTRGAREVSRSDGPAALRRARSRARKRAGLDINLSWGRRSRLPHAKAALAYSKHFFTSAVELSLPRYSYSINAGMGYFFSFSSVSTGLMGVSPSPQIVFSP